MLSLPLFSYIVYSRVQRDIPRDANEEREHAQEAREAGHVDQEDLGHHEADQRHAGMAQRGAAYALDTSSL